MKQTNARTPATTRRAGPSAARRRRSQAARPVERDRTTEEKILDAAHTVFVRRGTSGARMQDIAKEANVNQALLHYYFRHKDRLSEAVFRRAAGELMPRVMQILASDGRVAEKVAQIVTLEIDQFTRTPYLPGYIISELQHHPERAHQLIDMLAGPAANRRAQALDVLRRQLATESRARRILPISAEQFIVNLVSLCIFPFAARPMIMALLGLSDADFIRFIDARRTELPTFFLRALQP